MQSTQNTEPPSVDIVVLNGSEYLINWKRLTRGASFFLPTTATPKQAEEALAPAALALNMEFAVRARCEYGRFGVRVWRVY
jgi:hypothetical protein